MTTNLHASLTAHLDTFNALSTLFPVIEQAASLIAERARAGQRIFACGNGGSAADAQHFAAELTGRYIRDRQAYAGIALTVDTSALTAIGNDYGFDEIFARQLSGLGQENDVLVAISTSGNSQNVIRAVEQAQAMGIDTIGLLGRDGGKLHRLVDTAIIVPSDSTPRIQEAHIFILHQLCEMLEP